MARAQQSAKKPPKRQTKHRPLTEKMKLYISLITLSGLSDKEARQHEAIGWKSRTTTLNLMKRKDALEYQRSLREKKDDKAAAIAAITEEMVIQRIWSEADPTNEDTTARSRIAALGLIVKIKGMGVERREVDATQRVVIEFNDPLEQHYEDDVSEDELEQYKPKYVANR